MSEVMPPPAEKGKDRHYGLPLSKWNGVQIELMKRSDLDHLAWKEKYSPKFEELIGKRPDLVQLIWDDEERAVEEIEALLEEMD